MKIIINGFLGKMGQAVLKHASKKGFKIVAGIDPNIEGNIKYDFPVFRDINQVAIKSECIIDFSIADALPKVLEYGLQNEIPLILATTGYNEMHQKNIDISSKKIPIFQSANMSSGVAIFKMLVLEGVKAMSIDYDIEILEAHHNQKIDAPSGTALMLKDEMTHVIKESTSVMPSFTYGRKGQVGKRNAMEIGIHAIRGGNIPGTHEVLFLGENQNIKISHEALDRSIFALGALDAAKFIKNKLPGKYTMDDLVRNLFL